MLLMRTISKRTGWTEHVARIDKVKVKLSLFLLKCHTINTYEGQDIYLKAFLTSQGAGLAQRYNAGLRTG
jgi:hypothetical protein